MQLLTVYGGAFDPVHSGHLRPLFALSEQPEVGQLTLLPCGKPASAKTVSPARHRLAMLRAVKCLPGMTIDTRELQRQGPSYTVDTLEEMRLEAGAARPLAFVLGQDAYAGFQDWFRYERILELVHLIVVARPGFAAPAIPGDGFVGLDRLTRSPHGSICFFSRCRVAVSATQIRNMIARGREPCEFLFPAVWQYICRNRLYGWRP